MKKLLRFAFFAGFVVLSAPAHALRLHLDRPGLALPQGFPDELREQIQRVLEQPESKFLGGTALNWFTTLRYSGSTKALNLFLDGLSRCEGTAISVLFVESLPEGEDWQVSHPGDGKLGFTVRISLPSKNLRLSELVLPEIRGAVEAGEAHGK